MTVPYRTAPQLKRMRRVKRAPPSVTKNVNAAAAHPDCRCAIHAGTLLGRNDYRLNSLCRKCSEGAIRKRQVIAIARLALHCQLARLLPNELHGPLQVSAHPCVCRLVRLHTLGIRQRDCGARVAKPCPRRAPVRAAMADLLVRIESRDRLLIVALGASHAVMKCSFYSCGDNRMAKDYGQTFYS
jgi:hypothetical protein